MKEVFYFLATQQYETEAAKWLLSVKRGENASVLFVPKTDRFVRLGQLMNDQKLLKKAFGDPQIYILQQVNFDAHDIEELGDLQSLIAARVNASKPYTTAFTFNQIVMRLKKANQILVLFIVEAEKYLVSEGKQVLSLLSQLTEEFGDYIRIISFFEADITHTSLLSTLPASPQLYENVFYYPLYSRDHTLNFIQLLQHYWNMSKTITAKEAEKIYEACGGHFWLVKEAVRAVMNNGRWDSDQEGMLFRLRTIYNLLIPSEKDLLVKIASHKHTFSPEEQLSIQYLSKMRIIDGEKKLSIGLFIDYVREHLEFSGELILKEKQLYLNQVPIDRMFSREEGRVIKYLVKQKNVLVSRDEIAKQVWPVNTQDQYSDWAIDQLMTRIRKRIQEISIPPRLLQVVRGKGYIFKI